MTRPPADRDHVGVHRQRDGRYYVGVAPHVGRTSGTQLWQVADLAEAYGSGRVRTTVEQKLLILDVPEEPVDRAGWTSWPPATCRPTPSAFRRGTMACTGIEFCKLAIVETKGRARDLYTELERRLPGFDTPITINVNGCPNSCARFQLADIGLKGSIVDGGEGFQVHLGGSLGADPGVRPQAARAEGHGGSAARLRRAAAAQLPGRPGRRRAVRDLGPPRRPGAAVGRLVMTGPARAEARMSERQVPFYCPYCGEETCARPGPTPASWECAACARGFQLRFTAVAAAPAPSARAPAPRHDRLPAHADLAGRPGRGDRRRPGGAAPGMALLAAGAEVTVMLPACCAPCRTWPPNGARATRPAGAPPAAGPAGYRDGDLAGMWLAHAATDDPAVNAAVAAEAERQRVWCVRADDASSSAATGRPRWPGTARSPSP